VKAEAWIFGSLTIFFLSVTPAYWLITMDANGTPEITGTAALILTFFLSLMIFAYLYLGLFRTARRAIGNGDMMGVPVLMGRIRALVIVNLVLGTAAIAAVTVAYGPRTS